MLRAGHRVQFYSWISPQGLWRKAGMSCLDLYLQFHSSSLLKGFSSIIMPSYLISPSISFWRGKEYLLPKYWHITFLKNQTVKTSCDTNEPFNSSSLHPPFGSEANPLDCCKLHIPPFLILGAQPSWHLSELISLFLKLAFPAPPGLLAATHCEVCPCFRFSVWSSLCLDALPRIFIGFPSHLCSGDPLITILKILYNKIVPPSTPAFLDGTVFFFF